MSLASEKIFHWLPELEVEWLGRVPYLEAVTIQERHAASLLAGDAPERLMLLEHEPVYTIGRTHDQSSLGQISQLPHPLHIVSRGGQATYHGPGQLVGYPILDLRRHIQDLHLYLRALEQIVIDTLARFNISSTRREGLTGVWVDNRKICSIGVGVRKWITIHGFALNVEGPLEGFRAITPCGITGVRMTSINEETGSAYTVSEVAAHVASIVRTNTP